MARAEYTPPTHEKKPVMVPATLTNVTVVPEEEWPSFIVNNGYNTYIKFEFTPDPEQLPFSLSIDLPIYIELDQNGMLITKEPKETKSIKGYEIPIQRNIGVLYDMLDAIGYENGGGFNTSGRWENDQGKVIADSDIPEDIMSVAAKQELNNLILVAGVRTTDTGDFFNVWKKLFKNDPEGIKAAQKAFARANKQFKQKDNPTPTPGNPLPEPDERHPVNLPAPGDY